MLKLVQLLIQKLLTIMDIIMVTTASTMATTVTTMERDQQSQ